ncbi:MAG: protein kinase [Paracoccaceae bacterium]
MATKQLAKKANDEAEQLDELPAGTQLLHGQYTITRFLNNGGFGITYLAKDSLDRNVVIKECFADAFCRRTNTIVSARSRAHQNELKSIIKHFVQEARSLSKLVHPNIVGVHQVFEDNDTAYMAIDYVDGKDLLDILDDPNTNFTPEQIVTMTRKLLNAIGFVHDHGLLHRDISPDNILIDTKGEPILIDFGAARENVSATERKLSALRVVKDGYSPQEFYIAGSEQGPWSDLYALAASLYHVIKGEAPLNGQARLAAIAEQRPDPYEPLAGKVKGYPDRFLEAIDKAMCTMPKQRLQSAGAWLAMLDGVAHGANVDGDPEMAIAKLIEERAKELAEIAETPVALAEPPAKREKEKEGMKFAPLAEPAAEPVVVEETSNRSLLRAGTALTLIMVLGVAGYVFFAGGNKDATDGNTPVVAEVSSTATPDNTAAETEADAAEAARLAAEAEAKAAAEAEAAAEAQAAAEAEAAAAAQAAAEAEAAAAAQAAAEAQAEADRIAAAEAEAAANAEPWLNKQVSYALWDIEMPFKFVQRSERNAESVLITGIEEGADIATSGGWIADGVEIFTVNDAVLSKDEEFSSKILDSMVLDPDGYTRVSVRYKDPVAGKFERALLAVKVVRKLGWANGTAVETKLIDNAWVTSVTAVAGTSAKGLQAGDVLLGETTTETTFDGVESIEQTIAKLQSDGAESATLEVLRNGDKQTVTLELN